MSKYLPALMLSQGMTIELELDEAANSMASAVGATTHSQTFELEDCRCLCEQVTLTSELTDQYTSLLLSGKSIYIDLPTLSDNTVQYFPGNLGKFTINSARQYSRLNTLIVTFCQDAAASELVEKEMSTRFTFQRAQRKLYRVILLSMVAVNQPSIIWASTSTGIVC